MRRAAPFALAVLLAAPGLRAQAPAHGPAASPASPSSDEIVIPPKPKPRSTSIMVLELVPAGAPAEIAVNLTALIAAEVGRYDDIKPVTRREVVNLLDFERQRQLMGCNDDTCISQLVGALGVAKIVSGQLGRLEAEYVLTLQLIDARTAKIDARVVRTIPVDANQLVDAAKGAVTELIGPRSSSKNSPPRVAATASPVAHQGERVSLDASRCYDPDGDPLSIRWRQLDGPPALLENPQQAVASFVPVEIGTYTFAVAVTDGRSPVQEEQVRIEIRQRRRYVVGAAFQDLLAFNRIATEDAAGSVFRNRAPIGGVLLAGLKLSEQAMLVGEVGGSYMHVYREDGTPGDSVYLNVTTLHVALGLRYSFPFDGFSLAAQAQVGTARAFFTAREGAVVSTDVRSETLLGDVDLVVDIPLGERLGLVAQGGLRARTGTDTVDPFKGISFGVADNGFLWGINATIGAYFRL